MTLVLLSGSIAVALSPIVSASMALQTASLDLMRTELVDAPESASPSE